MNPTFACIRRMAIALIAGSGMCLTALAADNVLSFGASGQRVITAGKITTADFTAEAWVKPSATAGENQIFSQYIAGDTGRFIIAIRNNKAGFFIGSWKDGTATIPLNVWTHIAATRVGNLCTLYVNGVQDFNGTINASPLPNANFFIGAINDTATGFRGQISNVRVWNVVRTPAEIADSRMLYLTGNEPGLIHYWKLNEGTGATVTDTKTGAAGTIYSAAWAFSGDLPVVTGASGSAWTSGTGGNWSDTTKWQGGTAAQGANVAALFTNNPPAAITVTNNLPGLALGSLTVNGPAHTFTGGTLTLTNELATPRLSTSAGGHLLNLPLTLTADTAIDTQTPGAFTLNGTVSGTGGLSVNSALSGGGTVTLAAQNAYAGPTVLGSGTLSVNAFNALGTSSADPANLRLGSGTLRYTGGDTTLTRGFTVQASPSPVRAAVLHTDADLTVAGQVLATSGAFIKTGAGTLTFTHAGWNKYCAHECSDPNKLLDIRANGDSPTVGYSGFTVAQGRVVLGVPGQVNIISNRVEIGVFTTTNANAEHSAELVLNDGTLICPTTFSIGRSNGNTNTAPAGATSAFTMNGGEAFIHLLAAGYNGAGHAGYNTRARCQINGGHLTVATSMNMGENAGSHITLNVTGGTLTVSNATDSIRIGAGAGEGTFNLTGGEVEAAQNVKLAQNAGDQSKGTLNLDGGILTAANIVRGSGTNAFLNFNGGTFRPHTATTLNGLTRASVRAGGAVIDTTLADHTISQHLLHDTALGAAPDGGLVKLGTGTLTLASSASTYTGPTTVSNGILRITGALPPASILTVADGGEAHPAGTTVAGLTLHPGGILALTFTADGTANDTPHATAAPALLAGQIALHLRGTDLPFTRNGTYTILTSGGAIPSPAALTCANPVFGKSYLFAAAGNTLTVTIGIDTAVAAVWDEDADGAWATPGNWTSAPASGDTVRFDDAISAPRTVTTAGQTAGDIFLNSPHTYTLAGTGLTLAPDTGIIVESGAHAIAAPLTLSADTFVALNPGAALTLGAVSGGSATLTAQGSGTLTFSAAPAVQALALNVSTLGLANTMTVATPLTLQRELIITPAESTTATLTGALTGTGGITKGGSSVLALSGAASYAGPTDIDAGTLRVATPAHIPGALTIGNGTLHITGDGATPRGYTVRSSATARASVLRVDGDVTFAGQIRATSGTLVKTGPGTVAYTYPGANTLNVNEANYPTGPQDIGPYGDAPTTGFAGFTISHGRVILGVPGQTNTATRVEIGTRTTTAGTETAGELIVNGGHLTVSNTVSVGRNNGTSATAPGGLTSRLTVNGGTCNLNILASGNNGVGAALAGYNARPVIQVTGGQLNVGGTYLSLGESPGAHATLLVSGGTVNVHNASGTLRLGGGQTASNASGTGIARVSSNAHLRVSQDVSIGYGTSGQGELHLDGGTLTAKNIIGGNGTRRELILNGGAFLPHTAGQTLSGLTAAHVSTNGAVIDTTLAPHTVAQPLLRDPALGAAPDGGLLKLGTNTLTLTSAGNTFSGPVRADAGLLRARLGGTNSLHVAPGAAFDALGERATVRDLTGGGHLTNGTIAVTGTLNPGTGLTAENLALAAGAAWAVTNAVMTVTGALTPEGPGLFDLGRAATDPVPMPFTATVATCGTLSGTFTGWKATGTGLSPDKAIATVVTVEDGTVILTLRYGGTLLMLQ